MAAVHVVLSISVSASDDRKTAFCDMAEKLTSSESVPPIIQKWGIESIRVGGVFRKDLMPRTKLGNRGIGGIRIGPDRRIDIVKGRDGVLTLSAVPSSDNFEIWPVPIVADLALVLASVLESHLELAPRSVSVAVTNNGFV